MSEIFRERTAYTKSLIRCLSWGFFFPIPSICCVIRKVPKLSFMITKCLFFSSFMFPFCLISSSLIFIGHQKRQAVLNLRFIRLTVQVFYVLFPLNILRFSSPDPFPLLILPACCMPAYPTLVPPSLTVPDSCLSLVGCLQTGYK